MEVENLLKKQKEERDEEQEKKEKVPEVRIACNWNRHDICHKQRLCKIISNGVKLHFVNVILEQT